MIKRQKSWEIIIAGLAFISIGIYLASNVSSDSNTNRSAIWNENVDTSPHPAPPSLPGAIVIDLQNSESLKNLEELRHLKDLKNMKELDFEIRNLDKLIEQHSQNEIESESLNKGLQQLEQELQKIEQTDFNVSIQDKKLYINKNYDVDQAQWTEVRPGEFVFKDSFSTSGINSLDFSIGFGNLNIVGNDSEDGNITLQITGDIDDPSEINDHLDITKDISSSEAVFHVSSANGSSFANRSDMEATLSIPKNLLVNAKTSSGHITAQHLNNIQELNTSGGHITLSDLRGKIIAKTGGGHITSDKLSGDITMSTGGGHIKVDELDGTLEAKTGGGHIEIQEAKGSIMARTSGGNISSSIIEATDQLSFKTSAGNISLTLPTNINANLDISGTSVDLDDVFNFSGNKERSRITGTLNDGGLPIVISCGYGNVTINAQD